MKKDNRTEKNIKKKKRRKKRYLLRLLIIILACTGIYFAVHIDYFTVDGIAVAGNKDIPDEEIVKLSKISTGENIFDVHPWFAEKKIKKNLYIEDVNVRRKLPNKIEITVEERTCRAQFVSGKKFVVTDREGMVIDIAKEEQKATLVENVKVEKAELEDDIKVKPSGSYKKAMELIRVTEEGDLYFKKLNIADEKVDAYIYDGLVCRGTYSNLIDCIESGTLKTVVFDLYQKGVESGVINIGSNDYCSFTP